jgi:hypothetical protein
MKATFILPANTHPPCPIALKENEKVIPIAMYPKTQNMHHRVCIERETNVWPSKTFWIAGTKSVAN